MWRRRNLAFWPGFHSVQEAHCRFQGTIWNLLCFLLSECVFHDVLETWHGCHNILRVPQQTFGYSAPLVFVQEHMLRRSCSNCYAMFSTEPFLELKAVIQARVFRTMDRCFIFYFLDLLVRWLEKAPNIFPKWWWNMVISTSSMVESVKHHQKSNHKLAKTGISGTSPFLGPCFSGLKRFRHVFDPGKNTSGVASRPFSQQIHRFFVSPNSWFSRRHRRRRTGKGVGWTAFRLVGATHLAGEGETEVVWVVFPAPCMVLLMVQKSCTSWGW